MTLEQLKKKSKEDLAEMILAQEKEMGMLTEELAAVKQKLRDRTIRIENCGSIADASLLLTNVFTEAQTAADRYLENVERVQRETEQYCREASGKAKETADRMVSEAQKKSEEILRATARQAKELLNKAASEAETKKTEAERILAEARRDSEEIRTEALKFFVEKSNENKAG